MSQPLEAFSLVGTELRRPLIAQSKREALEADLARAQAEYDRDPSNEDAAIWLGRRLGYLGRYNEAIDVFNAAIKRHPNSYRLLRHRGHRYLTTRQIDLALEDFLRAQELIIAAETDSVEPDGAPNAQNKPRSSDWSNICYHLGLAHYCDGDLSHAYEAFNMSVDTPLLNDDMLVAARYWAVNVLAWQPEAKTLIPNRLRDITSGMDVIENTAYYDVLLLHLGEKTLEQVLAPAEKDPFELATRGYGVAMWLKAQGRLRESDDMLKRVLASGQWPTFGYLAAEADRVTAQH